MSARAVTAGTLSDLPPVLFYGWSITASAPDPINTQWTLPAGGGGRPGWMGGSLPALQAGLWASLLPNGDVLGHERFCFLPPRCSAIRPCAAGD